MKKMRKAAILAMLISVIFMFTAVLAIAQEEEIEDDFEDSFEIDLEKEEMKEKGWGRKCQN